MNITSKCADMDIPLYEIFNLNPDDFIDENITDLPFSVRILNRMQGNGVFTLSDLIKKTKNELLSIKNLGVTCLEEIHKYLENISKDNRTAPNKNINVTSIIKEHKDDIIIGNFDFESKCLTANDKYLVCKYKEGYECLGSEFVHLCVQNPDSIIPIKNMFTDFIEKGKKNSRLCELFEAIPHYRKALNAYSFINAFSIKDDARHALKSLCSAQDPLSGIIQSSQCESEPVFDLLCKFLKWCRFDLPTELNDLLNNIYSNDRIRRVIELRSQKHTLEQIGTELNVTRERIRQIEANAKRRFTHLQSRVGIISKISAERDGDSILTPLEIEEYCGSHTEELLFFLRNCPCNAYSYDSQLDVFVVGDDSLSAHVQNYTESLPDYFNKNSLTRILQEAEDIENLPSELLLKCIEENYRLTGDTYHRSRLSLAKIYENILKEYYPEGFKAYDCSELNKLRELIEQDYGKINLPESDRALTSRISNICVLCGRGIYKPKQEKYISPGLANKILEYITNSENSIFLLNTIFSVFEKELVSEGVDNKYYLQGILRELFNDRFIFRRDYLSKDGAETSIYKEIGRLIAKSQYPVSKKQIQDAYPGITDIVISFAVSEPDILNYFGSYLHASKLKINNEEKQYLYNVVKKFTDDNDAHFENEIFKKINSEKPEIFSRNAALFPYAMFSILEYLFADKFQFSRPFISKNGVDIESPSRKLREKVYSVNKHSINELMNYAKEIHYTVYSTLDYLNSINDDYLIIDSDHIQQVAETGINETVVSVVEDMILNEIDGCIPISQLNCLNKLVQIKIPWTDWLIYSMLNKWSSKLEVATSSNQFKLAVPLVAPAGKMDEETIKRFENYKPVEFVSSDNLDNIDDLIADYIGEDLL